MVSWSWVLGLLRERKDSTAPIWLMCWTGPTFRQCQLNDNSGRPVTFGSRPGRHQIALHSFSLSTSIYLWVKVTRKSYSCLHLPPSHHYTVSYTLSTFTEMVKLRVLMKTLTLQSIFSFFEPRAYYIRDVQSWLASRSLYTVWQWTV